VSLKDILDNACYTRGVHLFLDRDRDLFYPHLMHVDVRGFPVTVTEVIMTYCCVNIEFNPLIR
jgi:hypothetical protein